MIEFMKSLTCSDPFACAASAIVVVNAVGRYLLFNLSTAPTPTGR
jgi:hypothetical protein